MTDEMLEAPTPPEAEVPESEPVEVEAEPSDEDIECVDKNYPADDWAMMTPGDRRGYNTAILNSRKRRERERRS